MRNIQQSGGLYMLLHWLLLVCAWAQAETFQRVPDEFFGMHIHRAESKSNWPSVPFDSWRLWDAGVSWPALQPKRNRWVFRKLDAFVLLARQKGIEVVLPLGLSPTWASARPEEPSAYDQPGWAAEPAEMRDWDYYVRRVARRYRGQIAAYEIWNEPNLKRFYSGSLEKMLELTCRAAKIVHEEDPAAMVVSPAATDRMKGVHWLNNFLKAGGGKCIDIVGFHFYVHAHEPPETLVKYIGKVQVVMQVNGVAHLPLWNTETGWYFAHRSGGPAIRYRVIDLEDSAAYVLRALILSAGAGVQRFHWYAWNNARMGGLVDPRTGVLKPAAHAYRVAREWLRGAVIRSCLHRGIWRCTVVLSDGRNGILAWSPDVRRRIPADGISVVERFDVLTGRTYDDPVATDWIWLDSFPAFLQRY